MRANFVSHRPNRDPEPWVDPEHPSARFANDAHRGKVDVFDPRPEYTQTRDPEPWVATLTGDDGDGNAFEYEVRSEDPTGEIGWRAMLTWEWHPRHDEFDPPINRLLAAFRADPRSSGDPARLAPYWLNSARDMGIAMGESPTDIARARRILTLLAVLASSTPAASAAE